MRASRKSGFRAFTAASVSTSVLLGSLAMGGCPSEGQMLADPDQIAQSVAGPPGPQGPIGPVGETGLPGATGLSGPAGASPFTLSGSDAVYLAGNVGLGDATPAADLTVGDGDKFQVDGADGGVTFTDDQASIQFANSDIANAPMMFMFESGDANGDRMVLAHSPPFPNWGLLYQDVGEMFRFLGNGLAAATINLNRTDVTAAGGGFIWLGEESSANLALDNNEIMARFNGATSPLYLNAEGGIVSINGIAGVAARVGIGLLTPYSDSALHVRVTQDKFGILVDSGAVLGSEIGLHTNSTKYASLAKNAFFDGGWGRFDQTSGAFLQEVDPAGNVTFRTAPADVNPIVWNDVMTLSAAGNIGVGTPTPDARVAISGADDSLTGPILKLSGDAINQAESGRIRFTETTSTPNGMIGGYMHYDGIANRLQIGVHNIDDADTATDVDAITILRSNARVGIGRAPTMREFEVEGDASKTLPGMWESNSDRRIKTDVRTLSHALDTLDRVRLVSFHYSDEYRTAHPSIVDREYLNVIAQEFQEVFPDWVHSSGEVLPSGGDEILQVDTYPLTIYSAAAVQELHARVREKDAQVAALEARLARVESLLQSLPGRE